MLLDNIIAQADVKNQEYRIFICKPNKQVIREITSQAYDKEYSPKLSGTDEFSFSIPKYYDGELVQYYNEVKGNNFVKIMQNQTVMGYFEMQNPTVKLDGLSEIKSVKCYSTESLLALKQLYLTTGTFKLLNNSNPSNGLLNIITNKIKSWTVGYVDSSLLSKERYFDVSATNVLELLLNQCQTAFECIFIFDTVNNTINAYSLPNFGSPSPIIISMDNLIESCEIETLTNEIITKLNLYGSNDISVYDVNWGNAFIENYSYFMNSGMMSASLVNAINAYNTKVSNSMTNYTNYTNTIYNLQGQLVTANADLLVLQGELKTLEQTKAYNLSIGASITQLNIDIANKNAQIVTKQNQINTLNTQINSNQSAINALLATLDKSVNFTNAQLVEWDNFIREDVYQDSSYLVTDSFTFQQKIDVEKQLLDAGKSILARTSYPRYRINVDVVDFLKCTEFAPWWGKLHIGDNIAVRIDDAFVTTVRVTSYTHNWDNNKLTIQLGDKYQYDDPMIEMYDLIKNSVSTGTSIDFNQYVIQNTSNITNNEVLTFINSSLDLAKNNVIGGTHQEVKMDETGILFRRWDNNLNNYSPQQMRMTNNAIVLTDNSFNSAKTAIGLLSNGLYGISAEVIAGKMILGNNMIIETGNGSFRVDGSGVNITSMNLNMTSSDNLNKITISPTNGFKISSRPNTASAFSDKFYVDSSGNLQISGNITASNFIGGNINIGNGNFTVNSSGTLTANNANIIGNITGSNIFGSTISGSTATFGLINKVKLYSNGSNYGVVGFLNSSNVEVANIGTFNDTLNVFSTDTLFLESNNQLQLWGNYINFNNRPYVNGSPIALSSEITSNTYVGVYPMSVNNVGNNQYTISIDSNYKPNGLVGAIGGQDLSLQYYNGKLEVFLYGAYVGRATLVL